MALNWIRDYDKHENTTWEAASYYHDDGGPFMFRIKPKLRQDRVEFHCRSDHELCDGDHDFWLTLDEAKAAMEKMNETILHECSE